MNQPIDARLYTGALDCFVKIIKKDGFQGLYAGKYCLRMWVVYVLWVSVGVGGVRAVCVGSVRAVCVGSVRVVCF
jgi:hypothetical protein